MGQERIIHAALLGAGTVGSGVYKLVKDLEKEIISKTGARLVVDKILVRDTTKAREGIPSELLTDCWDEIVNDPQIEIVIERNPAGADLAGGSAPRGQTGCNGE